MQNIAQRVLHLHADQGRRIVMDRAVAQRVMQLVAQTVFEHMQFELAVGRLDNAVLDAIHGVLGAQAVLNQLFDRTDFEAVFLGKFFEFGTTGHRTVFVENLNQDTCRFQ